MRRLKSILLEWAPFWVVFFIFGALVFRALSIDKKQFRFREVPPPYCGVQAKKVYLCEFRVMGLYVSPLVTPLTAKTATDDSGKCYFILGKPGQELPVPLDACSEYEDYQTYLKKVKLCEKFKAREVRPPCVEGEEYEVFMGFELLGGVKYHDTEICKILDKRQKMIFSIDSCLREANDREQGL